ncbi:MAG TPA: hypothetical protein VMO00_07090 [Methylomirabilota bacterium]|nr:hypothetical protein [Methylomirabilota bacterium]
MVRVHWPLRSHQSPNAEKFILSHKEYEALIGFKVPVIKRVAVVGWQKSTKADLNWGDNISIVSIPNFFAQIMSKLRAVDHMRQAVPEGIPLLRAIQMALAFQ